MLFTSIFLQSWDVYFRNASSGAAPGQAYISPPTPSPYGAMVTQAMPGVGMAAAGGHVDSKLIDDHLAVQSIIRSFQVRLAFLISLKHWDS